MDLLKRLASTLFDVVLHVLTFHSIYLDIVPATREVNRALGARPVYRIFAEFVDIRSGMRSADVHVGACTEINMFDLLPIDIFGDFCSP